MERRTGARGHRLLSPRLTGELPARIEGGHGVVCDATEEDPAYILQYRVISLSDFRGTNEDIFSILRSTRTQQMQW